MCLRNRSVRWLVAGTQILVAVLIDWGSSQWPAWLCGGSMFCGPIG